MRKLCMCNKRHEELCWLVACKLLGTALPSRRDALRAARRGSGGAQLRGAIGDSVLFHVLQRVGGRDWLGAAQDTPR